MTDLSFPDLRAFLDRLRGDGDLAVVVHEPPVLIDARRKPSFPKEVSCDPDTAALVSRRWREYFPSGRVEMGDSERAHLDRR